MKITRKWFGWIVACGVLAGLSLPLFNLVVGLPAKPAYMALPTDAPDAARARDILGAKCLMCHAPDPVLPFYAKLPVASSLIGAHVRAGTAIWDNERLIALGGTDQVSLAKLEQTLRLDTMPILPFMLLHWDGRLTAGEKADLLAWIARVRAQRFASGLAAAPWANEAVQPLPAAWPKPLDEKKVALGRRLYDDVRLSGDNTVSCASCHALDKGGTDQLPFSVGVRKQVGGINAPTTFNAAFNVLQFWDGRGLDLADQAGGPPLNPVEMDSNWEQITGKLAQDAALTAAYEEIFGAGVAWTADGIKDCIAEFERTLLTPDSGLDRYLKGDAAAFAPEEAEGYALFKAHSCVTCHVGVSMGGQSFEKPVDAVAYYKARGKTPGTDDFGRFNVTKVEADRYKMKVPNLRNLALTFPYLHDSATEDLEEVVRLMHTHWVPALNRRPMSEADRKKIAAMLKGNTGTLFGKPL